MSQQQQINADETLQDRIDDLAKKSDRADELDQEVKQIEKKREQASSKNDAFRSLAKKISDTKEQHQQLRTWVEYASRMESAGMDVDIPQEEVNEKRSEVRHDLRSLQDRTWDEFDDASEVRGVIDEFENYREAFRELTRGVRETCQEQVSDELESVDRTETLLQIPDIGDEQAEEICRTYRYYLDKLKDGKADSDVTPDKWESYHSKFSSLDIDLGDDLTGEAKRVIWSLLEDETVTLAEIDQAVLDDLKSFEEFSERLSIQFTTQ